MTGVLRSDSGSLEYGAIGTNKALKVVGDEGTLPIRLTTTERNAVATPGTGLQIFNTTTNQFEYYDGAAWISGVKEIFINTDQTNNLGDYGVSNVTTNGSSYTTFMIPFDFTALVEAAFLINPAAAASGAGKDIDIFTDYAANGEPYNQHSEADTTSTYTIVTDQHYEIDISGQLTSIAPGDYVGVQIKHNAVGGTIRHFGVRFKYK
jgi:hypothetical protein